jgi:hypothetical protein
MTAGKIILAAALLTSTPASASDHMHIVKCDGYRSFKDCAEITIEGEIPLSDGDEFHSSH